MTLPLRLSLALAICASSLSAQAATYNVFGAGCPGSGVGLGAGHAVPQQYATTFMGGGNVGGFYGGSTRYQQVVLASELPSAVTLRGLGLRWTSQYYTQQSGASVDLEVHIGFTTKTPATMSMTFASNFDAGAPVTVLPRSFVRFPSQNTPPATNPLEFQVVIPWTTNFAWTSQPGLNLLVEWVYRGSSQGAGWAYVNDAGYSPSIGRVYGPATATAGTVYDSGYGYELQLIEQSNTATPVLHAADTPQFGNQVPIDLDQARGQTFALLVSGLSNTTFNGLALPYSLAAYGAAGCDLLASGDAFQIVNTNAVGHGRGFFDVPMDFGLAGLHFYNQFLVYDPAANGLGFAASHGGVGIIGN